MSGTKESTDIITICQQALTCVQCGKQDQYGVAVQPRTKPPSPTYFICISCTGNDIISMCTAAHEYIKSMGIKHQCCGLEFPDLYALEYHQYRQH